MISPERYGSSMIRHPAASSIVLLASCAPALPPVPVQPVIRSPSWSRDVQPIDGSGYRKPIDAAFWARFGSPTLANLVADGLHANATLEAARARIGQSRAQVRIARAALLPTVSSTIGLAETKTNNTGAAEFAYSAGSGSLDIAYDVDLFGGARAGKRSAVALAAAAQFEAQAAGLVVETDIARDYVALSALGDRIALLDRSLANARAFLRIVALRAREGAATRVDSGLQAVEVRKLEAQRLQLDQSRRATIAAIAVLVGREAPTFDLRGEAIAALQVPAIDPGQPGDLVFRRPDVRAAEARIAAARGDVQQARAAFKPGLHLSASSLVQALAVSGPFGLTLSAGQSVFAPIFQGGRLRGRLEQASSNQLETIAVYRGALLTSLQEGSNALSAVDIGRAREEVLSAAVTDARETLKLSRRQYTDGDVDFSAVLTAERNEIELEEQLVQARQDRLTASIDVYKALGGAPIG